MPTPPSAPKLTPVSQTARYSPWLKVRVLIRAALTLPGRPILLVTSGEPRRSVVSTLPSDRMRLLRAENGRWLYAPVPPAAPATR